MPLDTLIGVAIKAYNDSAVRPGLIRLPMGVVRPPNWTVTLGNKRFGMTLGMIHLGVVRIPVPIQLRAALNIQERERAATMRHNEIFHHARRAENDAMFQQAVRNTRLRIDQRRLALDTTRRSPNDR